MAIAIPAPRSEFCAIVASDAAAQLMELRQP
jgi:hypothetical protein